MGSPEQLNSDTFLGTFSAIESWLRQQVAADCSTAFSLLIGQAANKNRAVSRYANELKEFADLRNTWLGICFSCGTVSPQ